MDRRLFPRIVYVHRCFVNTLIIFLESKVVSATYSVGKQVSMQ